MYRMVENAEMGHQSVPRMGTYRGKFPSVGMKAHCHNRLLSSMKFMKLLLSNQHPSVIHDTVQCVSRDPYYSNLQIFYRHVWQILKLGQICTDNITPSLSPTNTQHEKQNNLQVSHVHSSFIFSCVCDMVCVGFPIYNVHTRQFWWLNY